MKNKIITGAMALTLTMGFVSCGDDFLETKYYKGIDVETGLSSTVSISTTIGSIFLPIIELKATLMVDLIIS